MLGFGDMSDPLDPCSGITDAECQFPNLPGAGLPIPPGMGGEKGGQVPFSLQPGSRRIASWVGSGRQHAQTRTEKGYPTPFPLPPAPEQEKAGVDIEFDLPR